MYHRNFKFQSLFGLLSIIPMDYVFVLKNFFNNAIALATMQSTSKYEVTNIFQKQFNFQGILFFDFQKNSRYLCFKKNEIIKTQ